ncbi:SDR family NAD(P)-dependent oxidoreductase [Amycolatopsis vancoresmycina]|uniref:Short-chain dehydrogenase/reductase SDR n=1 Tax=Amycolatopsis vancoresmycina DSM 44592 TaxID=1292037 RepID=R1IB53_9PSEU|nr:SDR family NAD(P)-dependent oxidoreductase [Amycolatopsis vancoresmycina]EOD67639.1 short-chain dehydrogenase/reductase SDR [Amycolatopsis vancoresmycina DSM 44592]
MRSRLKPDRARAATGRIVVVAGATSGIGLATAVAFAGRAGKLVLVSRSAEALDAAEAACRHAGASTVDTLAEDITDPAAAGRIVARTLDRHGRIDVVVHTATVMGYGSVEAMPADVFTAVVDTAVHGTLHLARAVLPVLRRQHAGTFIGVNSLLGSITVPQMGAYATSKWGQRAVLRTLQQETRDEPGVSVCIVSPGSINTPIYYQAANYTGHAVRPPWPVLAPERVAAAITRLADRPRRHVSVPIGPGNPLVITGFRLLPRLYDRLVGPLLRLAVLTRERLRPTSGTVHHPHPGQERIHGRWPAPRNR